MGAGSWREFYAKQMSEMAQALIDKADSTRVEGHRYRDARSAYLDAEVQEKEAADLRRAAGFLRKRQQEEAR